MRCAQATPGYRLTVDLETQTISDEQGLSVEFDVDPYRRHLLLNGLDDIALTLRHEPDITAYESKRPSWKRGTTVAA
jgi:3-isopropylmalate/(R)-2-methylmalate dehydratase small subunit